MDGAADEVRPDGVGETPWPGLDAVDRAVVEAMHQDGRASISRLAKVTHLAPGRVRQRFERLRAEGLLHTVALIDPGALGRPVVAHLDVTARKDNRRLAERLARVRGVAWIGVGADYESLLVQVSTASQADLVDLLNRHVRTAPDVERVSTALVLRSWSPPFAFTTPDRAPEVADILWRSGADTPFRTLDDADRALLGRLESDARMSLTAMAEHVGLSVPATRQRLMKLVQEGVVRLRTRPNSQAPNVMAVRVVMQTEGDTTDLVAELAAMPNVNFISESTGPSGLSMELLCAHEAQIGEGYERACQVRGVTSARLVRFADVVVSTGHW